MSTPIDKRQEAILTATWHGLKRSLDELEAAVKEGQLAEIENWNAIADLKTAHTHIKAAQNKIDRVLLWQEH